MKKVLGINVNLSAVSWALADRAESDSETGALLRAGIRVPNLSPVEKLAFARGDAAATNLQRKEQRVIRRMRNRYLLRRQRLIEVLPLPDFSQLASRERPPIQCRLIFAIPPNLAFSGQLEVFFLSLAKIQILYYIDNQFVIKFYSFTTVPTYPPLKHL